MKKAFFIGDSIRVGVEGYSASGYGYYIEALLRGTAEVFQDRDNSLFAQYTLRFVNDWAQKAGCGDDIDLVYWNNGMWDILRQGGDEPLSSPEIYRENLRRVRHRLNMIFPKAKIVFAYTTPVMEELASPDFFRKNSDVILYNRIAKETLEPLGVIIHDLYSVAKEIQPEHHLDWVHYDETGAQILAKAVAKCVKENI